MSLYNSSVNFIELKLNFVFHSYGNATSATVLMQHLSNGHRVNISTERTEEKQRKLTELFIEKKKNVTAKVDEKFVFTRRLLVWLCRDLLPFQLVEKTGFIDFFNSMNRKKTDIPTRQTISNMALDDMYKCLKTKLIGHLKETQGNRIYPPIFGERKKQIPIFSCSLRSLLHWF